MPDLLLAAPDALALVVCALAATTDQRTQRIPNRLTVTAGLCGLALNLAIGGVDGVLAAAAGATAGLVVFGLPAAFGLVGMGDVKLVMALGALVRWPLALPLLLYIALAGGAVALAHAVHHRRMRAVLRNVTGLGTTSAAMHRMPYAFAIALGCAWAVASRHVDALRLVGT